MIAGLRWPGAIIVGIFLALLVLREAMVTAYVASNPARAAMLWPSHPSVVLESGLAQIGDAAAKGGSADPALVDRLLAVSPVEPLAGEPFLVRGVQARVAGDEPAAGRAFLAARERNPRLVAARYFLADHYLRAGDTGDGLAEIAALARLVPRSLAQVAPYLASYARSPGVAPQVKALLRVHPMLESTLLNTLAADARDSKLALYLWSGRTDKGTRRWQQRMLRSLVQAGRFFEAAAAWSRFSGGLAAGRLDPDFRTDRLAPFGWTLASDASGVAEPQGQGRLHALYYGRDDKVLADQLLMLEPGPYRLSMKVSGASPTAKSLVWAIRCLPSATELADLALDPKEGARSASFAVPAAGCQAQRLELKGTAPEIAEQAEATVAGLRIESDRP
ncbi:MAG TPA: hypothetical protein VFO12_07475 [Sphingomicrobium sp.]|nr:hypothetical protein [Sphingomicrobium sp.]